MLRAASWADEETKTRSTVFLAFDDPEMQGTLLRSLQTPDLDIEIVGSAAELLEHCDPTQCGCLVLGQQIGEMSGLDLQARLADRGIFMPFLFLATVPKIAEAVEAMRHGALDVLIAPFDLESLVSTIREALEEESRLHDGRVRDAQVRRRIERLSPREREVLSMVISGHLTKQIAASLLISTKTVETHRSHIMKKLEVDCLAHLIRLVRDFEHEITNLSPTPLSDERSRGRSRRAS